MLAPSSCKSLSFVLVVAYALAGCGGAADVESDVQRTEAALVTAPATGHHASTAERMLPPQPLPPEPLPLPPPGACMHVINCLTGMQYDSTPGVCACVPVSVPTPTPACIQTTQCMSGTVFDDTPGVCSCVPQG